MKNDNTEVIFINILCIDERKKIRKGKKEGKEDRMKDDNTEASYKYYLH